MSSSLDDDNNHNNYLLDSGEHHKYSLLGNTPSLISEDSSDQLLIYMNQQQQQHHQQQQILHQQQLNNNHEHNNNNHYNNNGIDQQQQQQQSPMNYMKQDMIMNSPQDKIRNSGGILKNSKDDLSMNNNNNGNGNYQHYSSPTTVVDNSTIIQTTGSSPVLDYHYLSPPLPPPPPPPPSNVGSMITTPQQISTQQIIMQHQNLRPITERGQEDKKKEALSFLNFYFKVNPASKTPTVRRSTVLALYTNKISIDKRYRQPNDMANLCGAVYTFIFQYLDSGTVMEYITSAENERLASKTDVKKRKRKKNHDTSNSHQDINPHDAFLTCIKYATLLPFIEFTNINELNPADNYTVTHPDWLYSLEDLYRWEVELKDIKSIVGRSCNINSSTSINLPVNVTETPENFIIYAFIPFYKPNALKITVNQMDITLEGTISLPETIQIPNGTEIVVPSNLNHNCTQCDIAEGNFSKVIKLTSPIASSTVGKRDGVVVIIAKKEERQTTVHQL
eukprot:gene8585-10563_t